MGPLWSGSSTRQNSVEINKTTAEAAIAVVQQVGFPVVVACWFMFRTDKFLNTLAKRVGELKEEILLCPKRPK